MNKDRRQEKIDILVKQYKKHLENSDDEVIKSEWGYALWMLDYKKEEK